MRERQTGGEGERGKNGAVVRSRRIVRAAVCSHSSIKTLRTVVAALRSRRFIHFPRCISRGLFQRDPVAIENNSRGLPTPFIDHRERYLNAF